MSAPQPLMNPGAILAGRWQIQDYIGSGETGEVYGVRDMHSTGAFALKLFWPNALGQAEIWSALQQTARTASGLGVDGVARAYDFGIDANSARPFVVAERVSWSSLADRVRLRGPLTPADVAASLSVLARALDAAHAVGLVHRDLKPENVFVSPENANWVRVSDFGVALLRSASPPPPGWGGTVGWVGPDAADPNARSTPAMDVFALGLVTFFALSGGALHRAARANPIDPGALWQELNTPIDSASARARELGASLDPVFDAWFQRALALSPQARFGTVGEMASAFEAIARTLFAPQSQNAVALQGVAAAIAQPLIFQPESLPPPAAARPAAEVATAVSAQYAPQVDSAASSASAGVKKRNAAPLFIGGAVICFGLTALGSFGLYQHRRAAAEEASAAALASASAAASAALAAAIPVAPPVPVAIPSTVPSATAIAAVEPSAAVPPPSTAAAQPSPPVPVPVAVPAKTAAALVAVKPATTAAAKTTAVAAKPSAVVAAKPSAVVAAKPSAVVAAKPAVNAKPAASAKPAAAAITAKPSPKPAVAPATAPKKKCGSVFIPCK